MASEPPTVNCAGLDGFKSFEDYAALLRTRTSFNSTLLGQCQLPICQALWGFGEPDLSGIGAATGYTLSFSIGTLLFPLLTTISSRLGPTSRTVITSGMSSFFESATYFALAIQVATIATLAPKDLETKTTSFGDYEITIAGVVSALSLLPSIPPIILLASIKEPRVIRARRSYRLTIFAVTVAPFTYIFFEQCIRNFGPSQIGEGQGEGGKTLISGAEWAAITDLCFGGVEYVTGNEDYILSVFQLMGSLFVFLFIIGFSVPAILQQVRDVYGEGNAVEQKVGGWVERGAEVCRLRAVRGVLLSLPCFLSVPLLWGFWRLRDLQGQLAASMGVDYEGNEWSFGQVMAITVFVPVGAEMIFAATRKRLDAERVEEGVQLESQQQNIELSVGSHEKDEKYETRRRNATYPA
ncbi:hypothetical protein QBC34DRAFT_381924 [Podospora aff. communis PSN243]|uniref:Uncharacterized protein n=1 Tax=Podospora aff. communis PSN243 TaxID=3040156 RepID=A0AAV9GH44_9PEZI|nr:hypothetical protein QBC34DRAFT_381924 [Podospora aff. communis PSN243]